MKTAELSNKRLFGRFVSLAILALSTVAVTACSSAPLDPDAVAQDHQRMQKVERSITQFDGRPLGN